MYIQSEIGQGEIVYLGGIALECETIKDSFEKDIAEYEFPYRNGALLDDLGQKARKIEIRCYFYEETYDTHKKLLACLDNNTLFDLVHPKYGLLKGLIKSVSVSHDECTRTAAITLTFIEDRIRNSSEDRCGIDVKSACEKCFADAVIEQCEAMERDFRRELGAEAVAVMGATLVPGFPTADQIKGISYNTREFLKEIDASVATFEALQTGAQNPANSLLAMLSFGENLPGRIIGAMARTVERYARASDSLIAFPGRFLSAVKLETDILLSSFEAPGASGKGEAAALAIIWKHLGVSASMRLGLEAAYLYKADEGSREELLKNEQRRSFDALGNYRPAGPAPAIMTMGEIEKTLAVVHGAIREALTASRGMESLKNFSRTLLEYVNTIKLDRERITQVMLHNPMPLHLLCLANGLPYTYAERIHSINRIHAPNFAEGTVNIYAR